MKKLTILLIVTLLIVTMISCGVTVTPEDNAQSAESVIANFDNTGNVEPFYVIRVELRQQHTILNLDKMIKDEMNKIEFDIPVDKRYYDSLNVGDEIVDEFRMGSVLIDGSFGSWKCTVVEKGIVH